MKKFVLYVLFVLSVVAPRSRANDPVMLKPTGEVFQDLKFTSTHPFSFDATTILFGNTAGKVPFLDGSGFVPVTNIPSLDTAKITTGTFADARIASASTWNAKVPSARTINTTAPITGGGDFSADRTFSLLTTGWPSLAFGNTTATSTSTPLNLNLGGTYSSAAGANPKLILSDNGTVKYGLGVSSGQLDFMAPTSAIFSFYINGVQSTLIDSASVKSHNITITGDGSNPYEPLTDLGGNIHQMSPFSKDYDDTPLTVGGPLNSSSSAFGAIKQFTNNGPFTDGFGVYHLESYLQTTFWIYPSINPMRRGEIIGVLDQSVGWSNLFLQPDTSAHVVFGSQTRHTGGLVEIHEATDKNLSFELTPPSSRLGLRALNDATSAYVDFEIQANSVLFTQGPISIGNITPGAGWLTIQGGSTSRGGIVLTSGTLTTVHWPGLIENDGTWLYYTNDAAARQFIATNTNSIAFSNKTFTDGTQFGGNVIFSPNNSFDIGASGNMPRAIHLAGPNSTIDGGSITGNFGVIGGSTGVAFNDNANANTNVSWDNSGNATIRGTLLLKQTGLLLKGGDSNTVNIKINETETAARTFNLKLHDADRTIDLTGNLTLAAGLTTTGTSAATFAFPSSGTPTYTFPAASQTLASLAGTETLTNKTESSPVISGGLTASGSGANNFSGSTGTFSTSSGANTLNGTVTVTPPARSSGAAAYFTLNIPADTAQTAATESIGFKTVTATRQWATTGTVALQRENFFAGPTYSSASASQTFTDAFTFYATPPVAGTNAIFTRGHTLGIVDSTSAASSITGAVVIANTLGTTATSVGIGGGNINAGGTLTVGGNSTLTGLAAIAALPQTQAALRVRGGTDMNLWVRNDQAHLYIQAGNDAASASVPMYLDASAFQFITGNIRLNAYGAGTLITDASGNVTASSDERLKDIDGKFTRGLADLRGIQPIAYHWKASTGFDRTEQYYGFSAQNVAANIPEAVALDPAGFYSFNDRPIEAALVNAVNELDARLSRLEGPSAPKPDPTDRYKLSADRLTQLQARLQQRLAASPKPASLKPPPK